MPIRKLVGAAMAALSLWMLYERISTMNLLVARGESWGALALDPVYILPNLGALMALFGGLLALQNRRAWPFAAGGMGFLLLFVILLGAVSGNLSFLAPFWLPVGGLLALTLALIIIKPE